MLSLMAPAFKLLVAGALQLGVFAFLALYVASAGLMYALMYASFLQSRRLGVGHMPRCSIAPGTLQPTADGTFVIAPLRTHLT